MVYTHYSTTEADDGTFDINRYRNNAVVRSRNGNENESTIHFWLWDHNLLNNKCHIIKHYTHSYEIGEKKLPSGLPGTEGKNFQGLLACYCHTDSWRGKAFRIFSQ